MKKVTFELNGTTVTAEAEGLTLLQYLRGVACMKGAKEGCSTGHCGACTVIIDGRAVRSCVTRMDKLDGAKIQTIEGLHGENGALHPIQQSFLDIGAVQCGFCTPGMIMAAKALLDSNPDPTDEEIYEGLKHNYCRCTGYVKIIEAVHLAAARLRGENPPLAQIRTLENIEIASYSSPADTTAADLTGRHIGKSRIDCDGVQKVRGTLPYTCDRADEGTLYGAFVWAKYPRARILSIDCTDAEQAPGVVRILTYRDVPGRNAYGTFNPEQPVFCRTEVNFLGDIIALVIGETEAAARAAARLVEVEYEVLPGIYEIEDSYAAGGRQIIRTIDFASGDFAAEMERDDLVEVKGDYYFERQEHGCLEPECCIGEPDPLTGGILITCCTQSPFEIRRMLPPILNLPEERVRVIAAPLGGGFGKKCDSYLEPHAALAAMVTGRKVQITLKRSESLLLTAKRHRYRNRYEFWVDKDGRFSALKAEITSDAGPYAGMSGGVLEQGCIFALGPYRINASQIHAYTVRTNTAQGGAFRGFGINQSANCIETLIDEAAEKLGLDPFEIRLRNALAPGDRTMTTEIVMESVGILQTIRACRDKAAPIIACYREEYRKKNDPDLALGVGVASGFKNVGVGKGNPDNGGCILTKLPDGRYRMALSGTDMGQGFRTAMVQIAAETLDADEDAFDLISGDTAYTLPHRQAVSERQTLDTGWAVYKAAKQMRDSLAAHPWKNGERRETQYYHVAPKTYGISGQAQAKEDGNPYQNYRGYAFLTGCVILEVNKKTGKVRVLHIISANDVGRAINPQIIAGQVEGGNSMGIGYALSEGFSYTDGRPDQRTFGKLGLPGIHETPRYDIVIVEDPHIEGPYGAKGCSEVATVPSTPAVLNALYDAVGVRFYKTPVRPEDILSALREKEGNP